MFFSEYSLSWIKLSSTWELGCTNSMPTSCFMYIYFPK
jgi:hypothetical protein